MCMVYVLGYELHEFEVRMINFEVTCNGNFSKLVSEISKIFLNSREILEKKLQKQTTKTK